MVDLSHRAQFLNLAAVVEGGLVAAALALGWLVAIAPFDAFHFRLDAAAWGVAATLPLIALFALSLRFPLRPLARIHQLLVELLGPSLAACRWYDLVLLALLAGVSEELLFRGVIQPWLEGKLGPAGGLVVSNVLFGLAHSVTLTYTLLAGGVGVYLGVLLEITGERNLLTPMLTHALYDYLAFLIIVRMYRARRSGAESAAENAGEDAFTSPDADQSDDGGAA